MGTDKARLPAPADDSGAAQSLAERTAGLLRALSGPVIEVGPGSSGLPAIYEDPPGSGPLVALACGWGHLRAAGWEGQVVVAATDLPLLTGAMIEWLASVPGTASVVPLAAGRPQFLCARYSPADLDRAAALAAAGHRRMSDLLGPDMSLVDEDGWGPVAGGAAVLGDVDTPADLTRIGLATGAGR